MQTIDHHIELEAAYNIMLENVGARLEYIDGMLYMDPIPPKSLCRMLHALRKQFSTLKGHFARVPCMISSTKRIVKPDTSFFPHNSNEISSFPTLAIHICGERRLDLIKNTRVNVTIELVDEYKLIVSTRGHATIEQDLRNLSMQSIEIPLDLLYNQGVDKTIAPFVLDLIKIKQELML